MVRRCWAAVALGIWLLGMPVQAMTTPNCRENEFPTRERGCVPFESLTLEEIFGPEGMGFDVPPEILQLFYQEYNISRPNAYQGVKALPVRVFSTEASFQATTEELLAAGGQTVDTRLGDIPAFSNPTHLPDATLEQTLKQFYGPSSQNPRGQQPLGSVPAMHDLVTRGAEPGVKEEMRSVPLNRVPQVIRERSQRDQRYAQLLQNLANRVGTELLKFTVRELGLEKMVPGITGIFQRALVGDWQGMIRLAIERFVDWVIKRNLGELGVKQIPALVPYQLVGLAPANERPTTHVRHAFLNHVGTNSLDCQCEGRDVKPLPSADGPLSFGTAAEALLRVPGLPRQYLPRLRINTACRDPQAKGVLGAATLFRGYSSTFAKTFALGCFDATLSMTFSAKPARDALSARFCFKIKGARKPCQWLGETGRCAVPLRYTLPEVPIGQFGVVFTSLANLIDLFQGSGGRCPVSYFPFLQPTASFYCEQLT